MSLVNVVCCQVNVCDGPIPRPEESCRLWCVIVCDLEISSMRRPWPALGSCARNKKANTEWHFTADNPQVCVPPVFNPIHQNMVTFYCRTVHKYVSTYIEHRANGWRCC